MRVFFWKVLCSSCLYRLKCFKISALLSAGPLIRNPLRLPFGDDDGGGDGGSSGGVFTSSESLHLI